MAGNRVGMDKESRMKGDETVALKLVQETWVCIGSTH